MKKNTFGIFADVGGAFFFPDTDNDAAAQAKVKRKTEKRLNQSRIADEVRRVELHSLPEDSAKK
ncbi:hypothetical protein UP09_05295 [Bradyrhizobium sp. LTSP885]|uniref:hypothetical protein n=1 Tax=Bradyrhizobium sp. LTSP885 TaxID=1619232 RepID=UPI0005CB69D3|nr:hypothetical protein [Bradyrhizobium sp. LTSP885]KJC50439.1 hypothetical protein UP09_05295 [Bradyrhizobium sp. LTSP885]